MVIKNSMKLMRLINSNIVDKGIKENKKRRKAYVYLDKNYLKGVREEEMFRNITWICAYEDIEVAEKNKEDEDSILVQFNIEEDCYNAGLISSFGKSANRDDNETLIPPYSVCTVKKISKKKIELDLARNNLKYGFSMNPRF